MRVIAHIRASWRNGWGILDTLRQPTLTVSIQRTGWIGDAGFESPHEYPLGAELQLIRADTGETLWLGKIVGRNYRSTEKRWQYKLRGICEHFLDLPFPYAAYDYNRTRTGAAQSIWEYHLPRYLRYHTPRYQPIYNLNLASLQTRDLQLRTVRDAYKLYQAMRPAKITPELLSTGRIRMHLDEMPLSQTYPPPRNAQYELSESILETANRISLTEPAKQMLKDRRLANPEYWELIVPPGATATVTVHDPNQYGYLGAYATRIDVEIAVVTWVGVRYRERLRAPRNSQGQYLPLTIGWRARGDNANLRLNFNGTPTTPQGYAGWGGYAEQAYTITPVADEFWFAIEIQPITATLPAAAVIDAVYCIPAPSNLDERDYPPHLPVADHIPSYLNAGISTLISAVAPVGGGVYDLVVYWDAFPPSVPAGATVQILQNSRYLTGTVVNRQNPTTLRVQITDPYPPQMGDILYLAWHPTNLHAGRSELLYDTLYTQLETPAAPVSANLANFVAQTATPSVSLTAQFPLGNAPLPQIGQVVPHPHTGELLPIYEIELPVNAGNLSALQVRAGSPELTMRALLRRLNPVRTRTP